MRPELLGRCERGVVVTVVVVGVVTVVVVVVGVVTVVVVVVGVVTVVVVVGVGVVVDVLVVVEVSGDIEKAGGVRAEGRWRRPVCGASIANADLPTPAARETPLGPPEPAMPAASAVAGADVPPMTAAEASAASRRGLVTAIRGTMCRWSSNRVSARARGVMSRSHGAGSVSSDSTPAVSRNRAWGASRTRRGTANLACHSSWLPDDRPPSSRRSRVPPHAGAQKGSSPSGPTTSCAAEGRPGEVPTDVSSRRIARSPATRQ